MSWNNHIVALAVISAHTHTHTYTHTHTHTHTHTYIHTHTHNKPFQHTSRWAGTRGALSLCIYIYIYIYIYMSESRDSRVQHLKNSRVQHLDERMRGVDQKLVAGRLRDTEVSELLHLYVWMCEHVCTLCYRYTYLHTCRWYVLHAYIHVCVYTHVYDIYMYIYVHSWFK
jgi:hypothetical protein